MIASSITPAEQLQRGMQETLNDIRWLRTSAFYPMTATHRRNLETLFSEMEARLRNLIGVAEGAGE